MEDDTTIVDQHVRTFKMQMLNELDQILSTLIDSNDLAYLSTGAGYVGRLNTNDQKRLDALADLFNGSIKDLLEMCRTWYGKNGYRPTASDEKMFQSCVHRYKLLSALFAYKLPQSENTSRAVRDIPLA
jgi:hypothetical protein